MKGAISLCVSVLALGICLPASFGLLSNEKRSQGQNMFGGYGNIHIAGNYSQHFYYDDTNFYYRAFVPTWGNSFFELYAYDFEMGESYRVCKRVSCTHKNANCPVHPCYQTDNVSGEWALVDNQFVTLKKSADELHIRFWDPLSDAYASAIDIPRYNSVSDEQGLGGKYESFFNDAIRLNNDMILLGYNNEMHIYDNSYNEKLRFSCRGLLYPLVAGNKLFWSGMRNELNYIDLENGKIENNILDGLFDAKQIISIKEQDHPFSAFAYSNELYFPREGVIYAFNPATHSLRKIAETDALTEEDPYACFNKDNLMYYKKDGVVHTMDLDTHTVSDLPDLPKVPCAAVRDMILFVEPETTGSADIECYDISGKQVHT